MNQEHAPLPYRAIDLALDSELSSATIRHVRQDEFYRSVVMADHTNYDEEAVEALLDAGDPQGAVEARQPFTGSTV